jgi:hypothetical protein
MAARMTVSEQPLSTPVYSWSAVLPGEGEPITAGLNLFGPDGHTFTSAVPTSEYVGVSYTAPKKGTPYTQFILRVSDISDLTTMPWIGFRNVAGYTYTYTGAPKCDFPRFDEDGDLISGSQADVVEECLPAFLNHKHPQAPYWHTQISLRVPNIDYSTIPVGGYHEAATAQVDIFVTEEGGVYSRVGYDPDTYLAGKVVIARTGEDTWTTTTELPVVLAEVFYTTSGGKRPTTATVIPQTVTTYPIKTQIDWTRTLQ